MEYWRHFFLDKDTIGYVLVELQKRNYEFRNFGIGGTPISKYEIDRNVDLLGKGMLTPVIAVEHYKHYKFIKITTVEIMDDSIKIDKIQSYEEFLEFIGIN